MIRLGDQDYLTVAEAAEAFNVSTQNINQILARHDLNSTTPSFEHLQALKDQGVIPLKAPSQRLLPRATIDELVRIINTDEAKAAYRQIIGEWREAKKARPSLPGQAGSSRTGPPYDRTQPLSWLGLLTRTRSQGFRQNPCA